MPSSLSPPALGNAAPAATEPPLPASTVSFPDWKPENAPRGTAILTNAVTLGAMKAVLDRSMSGLSVCDLQRLLDEYMKAAGNLTDPVERMLLEQLVTDHHYVLQMKVQACRAETVDQLVAYNTLLVRFRGEFRQSVLALRQYRSPVSGRSVKVVQQNLTSGPTETRRSNSTTWPSPEKRRRILRAEANREMSSTSTKMRALSLHRTTKNLRRVAAGQFNGSKPASVTSTVTLARRQAR